MKNDQRLFILRLFFISVLSCSPSSCCKIANSQLILVQLVHDTQISYTSVLCPHVSHFFSRLHILLYVNLSYWKGFVYLVILVNVLHNLASGPSIPLKRIPGYALCFQMALDFSATWADPGTPYSLLLPFQRAMSGKRESLESSLQRPKSHLPEDRLNLQTVWPYRTLWMPGARS